MQNRKPIILTFIRYYLPGYKSGGPVRTIANLVEQLGDEVDFQIVTLDRDAVDTQPYAGVQIDAWNTVGKAQVFYASLDNFWIFKVAKLIQKTPHDAVYLNSFFDPIFTISPLLIRWVGLSPKRPWIIAPRGEFSKGALMLKSWKKNPFIALVHKLGVYSNLIWQASSKHEAVDIECIVNPSVNRTIIAPDLSINMGQSTDRIVSLHQPNEPLRVVFLSRISPMKNLDFALRVLGKVHSRIIFRIYGPVREEDHWMHCQQLIADLPAHISVTYHGSVEPAHVPEVMASHDLFFLPTRGENYGHVIAEALSAGTPVLIANTTPWRNLEQAGVGWDLPLDAEQLFAECIDYCAGLDATAYREWRCRIQQFAKGRLNDPKIIEANRYLFMEAIRN